MYVVMALERYIVQCRICFEELQSPASLSGSDNVTEKENAVAMKQGAQEKPSEAPAPVLRPSAPVGFSVPQATDQASADQTSMPSADQGELQEQEQRFASPQNKFPCKDDAPAAAVQAAAAAAAAVQNCNEVCTFAHLLLSADLLELRWRTHSQNQRYSAAPRFWLSFE